MEGDTVYAKWGFPEWGFSYNALYLPLGDGNWQCGLMPEREIRSSLQTWNRPSFDDKPQRKRGGRWSSWDDHDDLDEPMERRIARDRDDFLQMFKVRIDRHRADISREFKEYATFIREQLRISSWDQPVDGAGITRILKQAVRDNRLIPAIDRDWSANRSVFRHYAPQYWPVSDASHGSRASDKILSWTEFQALRRANGELGGLSGGSAFDLSTKTTGLDTAESAKFGGMRGADGDPLLKGFDRDDQPLSEAEPFEYVPDSLSDDVFEVAARNVKMTGNEPGEFRLNPNGLDTDYFDGNGAMSAQYHESHGAAHGHNFKNGKRDDTHIPMSPIRWK